MPKRRFTKPTLLHDYRSATRGSILKRLASLGGESDVKYRRVLKQGCTTVRQSLKTAIQPKPDTFR